MSSIIIIIRDAKEKKKYIRSRARAHFFVYNSWRLLHQRQQGYKVAIIPVDLGLVVGVDVAVVVVVDVGVDVKVVVALVDSQRSQSASRDAIRPACERVDAGHEIGTCCWLLSVNCFWLSAWSTSLSGSTPVPNAHRATPGRRYTPAPAISSSMPFANAALVWRVSRSRGQGQFQY